MRFSDYITVTEAANLRGVTRQAILLLITNGRLKAEKIGNQYLIEEKAVLAFEGHAGGRPKQKTKKGGKR